MTQWMTIFKTEMLHFWRNKQIVWLPLVMMVLAIMSPLSFYYLPEIIELSGGLPDGAVFDMPKLQPVESLITGLEELSFMGTLIIIAISMGTIASERKSGLSEIIMTKPINPIYYITAKWFALIILALFSLLLALTFNWYYTNILFGDLSFGALLKTFGFYSFWFILVVTIVILFNSFLNKPGLVFGLSALTLFMMNIINTVLGHKWTYLPNQLTTHIHLMLETDDISIALYATTSIIVAIVIILLISASTIFNYKKL